MDNKKRFGVSISIKFAAYFALCGVIVTSVFYLVFQVIVLPQMESNIKARLKDFALIASNVINKEDHERIVSAKLTEDSNEYKTIKKTLQEVAMSGDQIDSIYTMVPTSDPNVMNFVVDSSVPEDRDKNGVIDPSEEPAGINEPYSVSGMPDLKSGLNNVSVDREPTTDKWGSFISAYAPLKTSTGKVIGLVGVDLRYGRYLKDTNDFKNRAYLIFGILVFLCMILGYIMGMGLVLQLRGIVKKIREMSADDSDEYIDVTGNDELSELFEMINSIVKGLREKKNSLKEEVDKQTAALRLKMDELEKLNNLMVGRELIMKELKKQIKEKNG